MFGWFWFYIVLAYGFGGGHFHLIYIQVYSFTGWIMAMDALHHAIVYSSLIVYISFPALLKIQLPLPQVFHFKWYMGHYNAETQKPQQGWTNNRYFAKLDKGPWKRNQHPKPKIQTVKKTISKTTGKPSFSGTAALKSTQWEPHFCKL